MSPITTHVLDIARGRPAHGMAVALEFRASDGGWTEVASSTTNADGRITNLLPDSVALRPGVYRLRFNTGAYFHALGVPAFYPEVHVIVQLDDLAQHYHIPLLLGPYGYSTYRGN